MEEKSKKVSIDAENFIRSGIVHGRFAFGERLSDRGLASVMNISRTPVREAFARLAAEDLVVVRPQSGTFVMSLTTDQIRAICAMRGILECGALRLAAGQDPDGLAAAVSVPLAGAGLALEDGDLTRAEDLDAEFHNALVAAASNAFLSRAYKSISDQIGAIRHRIPQDAERMHRAFKQHRRIVDLAVTGRFAEAESELSAHVKVVEGIAAAVIKEKGFL